SRDRTYTGVGATASQATCPTFTGEGGSLDGCTAGMRDDVTLHKSWSLGLFAFCRLSHLGIRQSHELLIEAHTGLTDRTAENDTVLAHGLERAAVLDHTAVSCVDGFSVLVGTFGANDDIRQRRRQLETLET